MDVYIASQESVIDIVLVYKVVFWIIDDSSCKSSVMQSFPI